MSLQPHTGAYSSVQALSKSTRSGSKHCRVGSMEIFKSMEGLFDCSTEGVFVVGSIEGVLVLNCNLPSKALSTRKPLHKRFQRHKRKVGVILKLFRDNYFRGQQYLLECGVYYFHNGIMNGSILLEKRRIRSKFFQNFTYE